jgi:hypothetical protein
MVGNVFLSKLKGASRHPFLDPINQLSIFVMASRHLLMVWNMYYDGKYLGRPIPPSTTLGLQL